MKRHPFFWAALSALTLTLPRVAVGNESTPLTLPRDLTLAEAKQAFVNFAVSTSGPESTESLRLFGMVDSRCAGAFEFRAVIQNPSQSGATPAQSAALCGIRITDRGGGLACVQQHANESCTNSQCTRLSDRVPAISLAACADGEVQLLRRIPNDDLRPIQGESFDTKIMHISVATAEAKARREARAAREKRVRDNRAIISACRKTSDDLQVAFGALEDLDGIGALNEGELERITRELKRAELTAICRESTRVPLDELESSRERLLAYASENPEYAHGVMLCMSDVAKRYMRGAPAGSEAFEQARATLEEAGSIEGLEDDSLALLKNLEWQTKVEEINAMAANGAQGNIPLMRAWPGVFQQAYRFMGQACYAENANLEQCSTAMNSFRAIQAIPLRAQAADYQRCTMNEQMQQQMAQAMGQQIPQGMPSRCGPNPQAQMSGMPQQPGLPGMQQPGLQPQMMPGGMPISNSLPGVMPLS